MDVEGSLFYDGTLTAGFLYELAWFIAVIYTGLVLGSFATALTYRAPRRITWIGSFRNKKTHHDNNGDAVAAARSACPRCGTVLKWRDLIPLLSWLLSAGKCRYCGEKIGFQYPLIEIITLAAVVLAYLVYGISWECAAIVMAAPFLVALFFIDLEHMILPNMLVAITGGLGLLFLAAQWYDGTGDRQALYDLAISHGAGFIVYAVSVYLVGVVTGLVLRKNALGMGDVKFFAVSGLWLGLAMMPVFFLLSGLFGVISGLGRRFFFGKSGVFPFGPSLIAALYVILIADGAGLDLYEAFFGGVFFNFIGK